MESRALQKRTLNRQGGPKRRGGEAGVPPNGPRRGKKKGPASRRRDLIIGDRNITCRLKGKGLEGKTWGGPVLSALPATRTQRGVGKKEVKRKSSYAAPFLQDQRQQARKKSRKMWPLLCGLVLVDSYGQVVEACLGNRQFSEQSTELVDDSKALPGTQYRQLAKQKISSDLGTQVSTSLGKR